MPGLILLSPEPLAGKTTVAAGLAQRFSTEGKTVSVRRMPGDDHAENDAALFSALKGASQDQAAAEVELIEAPAGDAASSLAEFPDARALIITSALTPMNVLADYCRQAGDRLRGAVINKMPARRADSLIAEAKAAGVDLLATLPEDRLLATPVLRDVVEALSAQTEHFDSGGLRPLDRPVIAPISADPGQGYFAGYGASAVIVRSDKPDLQLAALNASAGCLILTGGLPILSYVLERAEEDQIPLLRTGLDTITAVERIEAIFGSATFAGGDEKIKRITELMADWGLAPLFD